MKKSFKIITLISLALLGSCGSKTSDTVAPTSNEPVISDTTDDKQSEEAKSDDSKKSEESISQSDILVVDSTSIEITNGKVVELNEGETLQLNATILPNDTTDKTITWSCSDETVGTVDANGLFTAKEVTEDTDVLVYAKNGKCETSICITVKNVVKDATIVLAGEHYTSDLDTDATYKEGDEIIFKVVTESGYDIDTVMVGETALTATSYGTYSVTLAAGVNTVTVNTKAVDMKGYSFAKVYNEPHYANFTADDAVTVFSNNWESNLLIKEQSDDIKATDSYTVSAHIQTETNAPVDYDQLAVGMVVYYKDDNNFLIAYTQWVDYDKSGWCRKFDLTGLIDGNDVGWNDMWLEGAQINPHDGYDFSVRREKSAFTITLNYNGTEYKKSASVAALGDSKTTHLGIFNQDKKPVTYTNISYAPYEAPSTFEITSGSSTVTETADGTITYTTTTDNWKSGFAVKTFKEIEGKTKYTMSAHLQTSGSTPFSSEAYWGFVPFYQDANNFLIVYMDYNSERPNSRGLHIIGNLNGSAITDNGSEWGEDKWTDTTPIAPQNGFDFTVARDGATFTITVVQGDTTIDWTYTRGGFDGTLTGTKVGMWGHGSIGTITATNFKVSV